MLKSLLRDICLLLRVFVEAARLSLLVLILRLPSLRSLRHQGTTSRPYVRPSIVLALALAARLEFSKADPSWGKKGKLDLSSRDSQEMLKRLLRDS